MDKFDFQNIRIFDKFIDKFAQKYVEQRSMLQSPESLSSQDCGFETDNLMKVLKKNCIACDESREKGEQPSALRDIYRSDLGELLMTYYFEEKLEEKERFVIPLKNISFREKENMPGRGFDAIGYRKENDGRVSVLIGEAKVSNQKRNPPKVVDINDDSLYKSQKMHHDNIPMVLRTLSDYLRRLSGKHLSALGCVIIAMDNDELDKYNITYGCALVRDEKCVDKEKDFGKLKTNTDEFRPGDVNFAIFSFTEKTIDEAVDMFYYKVQELIK